MQEKKEDFIALEITEEADETPPTGTAVELAQLAWDKVEVRVKSYLDAKALNNIRRAYDFAKRLHAEQKRRSGEPYIIHPLAVAEILAGLHLDETSLVAAILHDVVEDTHAELKEIEAEFGNNVANIVDGLTKLAKVQFRSSQEKLAENFRKMIVAMSRDIRVIIIKIADRLHNMRTIRALELEKRQRISQETLDIYAPLAGRLGIYRLKAELEDLCLKELKPSVYFSLASRVAQKKDERENVIQNARSHLVEKLAEAGICASVVGRAKHFFSIYKKMNEREIDFEDIYDLFAVRVIVDSVGNCYEALGIIHNLYRPVPGRFKDYIAMPKANLYQSLHTTVIAAKGELLEIQIRTQEMHEVCEYGIAAHWAYKETRKGAKNQKIAEDLEHFNWLHQIVRHHKEISDPNEFLEAVKVDLFDEEVYVFSPRGDVFELRRGATCLDFAFAIHSDLGLRITGSKVNGRITPLRTVLQSGDVIEVMSGARITATQEWLSIITTSKARGKIRQYLRSEQKEEAKRTGYSALERAFQKLGTSFEKMQKSGAFQEVSKHFSVGHFEDLVQQVGYGKIDAIVAAQKISGLTLPEAQSDTAQGLNPLEQEAAALVEPERKRGSKTKVFKSTEESVRVQGMDGIVVRLARCCEPLPGQPIFGFVSRGRAVTIHAANCDWALTNDPARRVECEWNNSGNYDLSVRLRIMTHDKPGVLAAITKLVASIGINIIGAEVQTTQEKRGLVILRIRVNSIAELRDVHQKLEAVEGVISVERVRG